MATVLQDTRLQQATQNILQMVQQSRQAKLEKQRMAQEASQFATTAQQNQQRIDLDARAHDLKLMTDMVPFIKPDSTLAENSFLHPIIQRLYGVDPAKDPAVGGLVMNKETLDGFLTPLAKDEFNALPPEQKSLVLQSKIGKDAFGRGVPMSELSLEGQQRDVAKAGLQNFKDTLYKHPQALLDLGYKASGLEQPVAFDIGGKKYGFNSGASAEAAIGILRIMDDQATRESQTSNINKSLLYQASKSTFDELSKTIPGITFPQVMRMTQAELQGKLGDLIKDEHNSDIVAAAKMIHEGTAIAQGVRRQTILMSGGPEAANFNAYVSSDAFKGLPADLKTNVLNAYSDWARKSGIPFPKAGTTGFAGFGSPTFTFDEMPAPTAPPGFAPDAAKGIGAGTKPGVGGAPGTTAPVNDFVSKLKNSDNDAVSAAISGMAAGDITVDMLRGEGIPAATITRIVQGAKRKQ